MSRNVTRVTSRNGASLGFELGLVSLKYLSGRGGRRTGVVGTAPMSRENGP
jgi:hypothetical protein